MKIEAKKQFSDWVYQILKKRYNDEDYVLQDDEKAKSVYMDLDNNIFRSTFHFYNHAFDIDKKMVMRSITDPDSIDHKIIKYMNTIWSIQEARRESYVWDVSTEILYQVFENIGIDLKEYKRELKGLSDFIDSKKDLDGDVKKDFVSSWFSKHIEKYFKDKYNDKENGRGTQKSGQEEKNLKANSVKPTYLIR